MHSGCIRVHPRCNPWQRGEASKADSGDRRRCTAGSSLSSAAASTDFFRGRRRRSPRAGVVATADLSALRVGGGGELWPARSLYFDFRGINRYSYDYNFYLQYIVTQPSILHHFPKTNAMIFSDPSLSFLMIRREPFRIMIIEGVLWFT